MVLKLNSFIFCIWLFLSSCNNCSSKLVGEEKLFDNSKSYFPYVDKQNLVFEDQAGELLTFSIEVDQKPSKNCVEKLCELTADPFKSPPCEYYECETKSALIKSNDQKWLLGYTIYIDQYQSESTLFYDALIASLSTENVILQGGLPLDPHFTKPPFDKSTLPIINLMTIKAQLNLNGTLFTNVIELNEAGQQLFIQQHRGIIGFIINGKTYKLK